MTHGADRSVVASRADKTSLVHLAGDDPPASGQEVAEEVDGHQKSNQDATTIVQGDATSAVKKEHTSGNKCNKTSKATKHKKQDNSGASGSTNVEEIKVKDCTKDVVDVSDVSKEEGPMYCQYMETLDLSKKSVDAEGMKALCSFLVDNGISIGVLNL
ncbi:unnamed protein product, partial [Amoebophrya sp. A25]|eukprot:GSA25T00005464001.1